MSGTLRGKLTLGLGAIKVESLLPGPAIVIEAMLVYPWMVFISTWGAVDWTHEPLGLGSTLIVLAAAYLSATYAARRGGGLRVPFYTLLATIGLLALLIRLEQGGGHAIWSAAWGLHGRAHLQKLIAGGLFGVYLVWRGISLGRESITFERLYASFLWGVFSLSVLLVVWSIGVKTGAFQDINPAMAAYVAMFFFAGLAALALSNLRNIQEEAAQLGNATEGLSRRWISLAVAIALMMVLVALGVSSVVSLGFVTYFGNPLEYAARWLFILFLYIFVVPIGYATIGVWYAIRWIIHLLHGSGSPPKIEPPSIENIQRQVENRDAHSPVPDWLIATGKWGLLALVIGIVVFLLLRAYLKRRQPEQRPGVEETSESLWSWGQLRRDVFSWLAVIFGLLRRKRPAGDGDEGLPGPSRGILRGGQRDMDIRQLYRALLREGRRAGKPLRAQETPFEYALRLRSLVGEPAQAVDQITGEYVRARYGHEDPPDGTLAALNQAWRRLRAALRNEGAE